MFICTTYILQSFIFKSFRNEIMFPFIASGYMETDLFNKWFKEIFLEHCGVRRPVLLVYDNHSTHVSLELLDMAKANQVNQEE